ncbi:hypothetical protein ED92_35555 [Amycolatopsis sp. MJM2582]|uniref:SRPBCC domain-containing protein n=1 Tax=Amycolatopsis sp. MJM2582 TaxID=1427749 RepID=UPI0005002529|nr:SRPBCC domain-containing protein [Amycolatopsis sp. MJM2582]KFZ77194.1 hypothetical protein ED92_35555 [Amycolatopsis sp. MJM2582]
MTTTSSSRVRMSRRHRIALIGGIVLAVLAGYVTWSNLRPVDLNSSIEIDAPADRVWQVLTDLRAYPAWNPFVISAEVTSDGGTLKEGATLRNVLRDKTGDTTFTPTVLAVTPERELRWLGRIGPGLIFDGEHRFELRPLGPGRTLLVQSERFTGALVPFVVSSLRADTLPQFEALNRALAQRATALPS